MLVRTLLTSILLLLLASNSAAQASLGWSDQHGYPDESKIKWFEAVSAHPEGGVVAACPMWTLDVVYAETMALDMDVVRWSDVGEKLWSVSLTGQRSSWWASAIRTDALGVTYVGATEENGSHVVAIDPNGTVLWNESLPGNTWLADLAVAPNGDVVIVGRIDHGTGVPGLDSHTLVAAWSRSGVLRWRRHLALPLDGYGGCLAIDSTGHIAVASGFSDVGVARLAPDGTVLWTHRIHRWQWSTERVRDIAVAENGDVIVAGQLSAFPPIEPAHVARLDAATGVILWQRTWSAPNSVQSVATEVEVAADGTIWAVAQGGPSGNAFLEVLRFAADGTQLLGYRHPALGYESTRPAGLVLGDAGQAWVAGTEMRSQDLRVEQRAIVLQFDSQSNLNWTLPFATRFPFDAEQWEDLALTTSGDLVLVGMARAEWLGVALSVDLHDSPEAYCEAKENSLGCEPTLTFAGMPRASEANSFTVTAGNELNQELGMLLYGVGGPAALPFQGGTLCLRAPIRRTPARSSGGSSPSVRDCSGSYSIDMNAFAHGGEGGKPLPELLVPGTTVWCQAWGRDPGFSAPDDASLSNALRYVVLP